MIIYCTGCSHTEGAGLADAYIFPDDFPGDIRRNINGGVEWTNKRTSLLKQDPLLYEKLRQENLKRSWPAKLADLTNNKVINGGVGGASVTSMSMSLIHDLELMVKENQTPDLVLIALPSVARIPILNKNPIKDYMPLAFKNVLPSFIDNVSGDYKTYCQALLSSHSDEELLTFYLYHCISMKHTVKAITGKYPIFVKTVNSSGWEELVENSNIFLLKQYWNSLEFNKFVNLRGLETFLDETQMVLPDGHFKEYVHQAFAEYIAKELLNA